MDPLLTFIVILVGFYGLATSKNIIKSVFSVTIIESGVILLFLNLGNYAGGGIPIIREGVADIVSDPLPQALMITTIVIGSTVTALALMLCIKVFHHYGTVEWAEVLRRGDGK